MTHNVQPGVAPEMQWLTADELARLRELACTPKKSLWTDYGMLLAIAGFALSLATGMISAYVGYRKDIHDQQAQLASVLQTIQELTIKEAEVYEKYKGTAYEETATTLITTDINTALKTATRLAFSLGSNATTAELVTIADGQSELGDSTTAQRLFEEALSNAQNAYEESFALRYFGYFKIRSAVTTETRKEGERPYARAMSLDAKYDLKSSPYSTHFLRAAAAFGWSEAVAPFDCATAQTHFGEGVVDLLANPRNPEMDQMRRTALRAYSDGLGGVPTCKPSGQTVLSP
jgi:hypothetical protein